MPDLSWLIAQQTQPSGLLQLVDNLARTQLSTVLMVVAACTVVRLALTPILRKTEPHKRTGGFKVVRFVNEVLDAIVYAGVFVFLVIRPFAVQTFYIPSGSMLDTLQLNDYIVANKFVYRMGPPKVDDIFVFRPPREALLPGQNIQDFIKRVAGVPGDVVEFRGGDLYRNGKKAREPWRKEPSIFDFKFVRFQGKLIPLLYNGENANDTPATAPAYQVPDPELQKRLVAMPAEPIPPGFVMAVGDNRNHSYDSRSWGLVPIDSVVGRSELIWLPVNRWGTTR